MSSKVVNAEILTEFWGIFLTAGMLELEEAKELRSFVEAIPVCSEAGPCFIAIN